MGKTGPGTLSPVHPCPTSSGEIFPPLILSVLMVFKSEIMAGNVIGVYKSVLDSSSVEGARKLAILVHQERRGYPQSMVRNSPEGVCSCNVKAPIQRKSRGWGAWLSWK